MLDSMPAVGVASAIVAALAASSPQAAPRHDVALDHTAIECAVAGMHPKLRACVRAQQSVAAPRIYFRSAGGRSWHYVEMNREGGACYSAALPRPLSDLARFEYYV